MREKSTEIYVVTANTHDSTDIIEAFTSKEDAERQAEEYQDRHPRFRHHLILVETVQFFKEIVR